jgi:hypothetical protein
MLTGRAPGAAAIGARGIESGRPVQLHSVQTGAATCRVQSGNVFGR